MRCDSLECHREATHRAVSQGCDLGAFCSPHAEYEASNWRLEEEEEEEEEEEATPNGESR